MQPTEAAGGQCRELDEGQCPGSPPSHAVYTTQTDTLSSLQSLHRLWVVEYQYQDFLIAPAMSVVGLLAGAALEYVFRRATGWQYDLSNPFKQDDVMPVDIAAPAAGKLVGEETESSEGDDFQKPEKL